MPLKSSSNTYKWITITVASKDWSQGNAKLGNLFVDFLHVVLVDHPFRQLNIHLQTEISVHIHCFCFSLTGTFSLFFIFIGKDRVNLSFSALPYALPYAISN